MKKQEETHITTDEETKITNLVNKICQCIFDECPDDFFVINAAAVKLLKSVMTANIISGFIKDGRTEEYIESVLESTCPDGYNAGVMVTKA